MPTSTGQKTARCDGCFALKPLAALLRTGADHECRGCAKRWYVLAVEPGADSQVRKNLVRDARIARLDKFFGRVVVPRHVVVERRDGNLVRVRRKAFPGYVLVQAAYTPDVHHLIARVRGAWGLLPLKPVLRGFRYPKGEPRQGTPARELDIKTHEAWRPVSVASEELAMAMLRTEDAKRKAPPPAAFAVGAKVLFMTGPWAGKDGTVAKVKDQKVTVQVAMMGVPVDVETAPAALALQE